ncbi:MAG: XdhC family protein [Synergistales bacterium]|nr:XdhC family protein [Synergistales bacterium]
MNNEILAALHNAVEQGVPGIMCTVIGKNGSTPCRIGTRMWVNEDGSSIGTVGGGLLEHKVISEAQLMLKKGIRHQVYRDVLTAEVDAPEGAICGGSTVIFMEIIGRVRRVVIFGGGHVGASLAEAASFAGFDVYLWDDREEYANRERIPWGVTVTGPLEKVLEEIPFSQGTYAVVCTRAHAMDGEVLRLLEGKELSYVGMLSSRSKREALFKALQEKGVSSPYLENIFTPIGISIGAGSPQEIAISIMAEIIGVDHGRISIKERS